jgi:hypothetical protein
MRHRVAVILSVSFQMKQRPQQKCDARGNNRGQSQKYDLIGIHTEYLLVLLQKGDRKLGARNV